mgnify:CR=1 FL=1
MKIETKKESIEIIDIPTPSYYKSRYSGRCNMLTEDGLLCVNDEIVTYYKSDRLKGHYNQMINELLNDCDVIHADEFLHKYLSTMETFKNFVV